MAEQEYPNIRGWVDESTTPQEFDHAVEILLTPEDRKLFKDKALERVRSSLLGMSVFAPIPATFDRTAYEAVVVDDEGNKLKPLQIARLIEIGKGVGLLEETGRRLMVNREISPLLRRVLERYKQDSNS